MTLDTEKLISDVNKKYPVKKHPRILLTDEDLQKLLDAGDDPVAEKLLSSLASDTKKTYEASLTAISKYEIPDGIRLLATSRKVLDRVIKLAMSYRIEGKVECAERAYAEMEAAAGFPDWNPRHFLDTAEMSAALAIGYDWLYDWLGEERRAIIRTALTEKGLKKVTDDYFDRERSRTYRWYQSTPGNNWKMVCNGGMTMAALAIFDEGDTELCRTVLERAFSSTYDAVRALFSDIDGDYLEGLNYWVYASKYLAFHSASLVSATGSDYGLCDWVGLRKTPLFVVQLCGNTSRSFNFSDAWENVLRPTEMLWYGKLLGEPSISAIRLKAIAEGNFSVYDLLYYVPGTDASLTGLPLSYGGVGRDNASFRTDWETDGLFAAIHFGSNSAPHAHLDMGTFVLEYGGERFFSDLGGDNYNLRPYSATYRYRAEGHNTLVFDPSEKSDQERNARGLISVFEDRGSEAFAVCDISEAYPGKKVTRGIKILRDKKSVIIQDEISTGGESDIYWFAHTKATPEVSSDGRSAVLTLGGKKLLASILSPSQVFTVSAAKAFPTSPKVEPASTENSTALQGENPNTGFVKLTIHMPKSEGGVISVCFTALDGDGDADACERVDMKAIKEW